jgi:hypothetical protein
MDTINNFKLFIRVRRLISIFGLLMYPAILWIFRPAYTGQNPVALVVLGSLPHLLAGVLLPLSTLKPELIVKNPRQFTSFYLIISALIMAWLIMEEFYPVFSPTAVFDPFDVLFGLVGVGSAFLMYWYFFRGLVTRQTTNN